jgi:uncharacterized protein (DUF1800 family)
MNRYRHRPAFLPPATRTASDRWAAIDAQTAWEPWSPAADDRWDVAKVAHLHRRAGFGATWKQLEADAARTPAEVVRGLIDAAEPAGPADDDPVAEVIAAGSEARRLASWWLLRMVRGGSPVRERLTLFWHGHFATSAAKVEQTRLMLAQYRTLRELGLGEFGALARAISCDPAMLVWLDCRESRKAKPNENFARELMELFCLGLGQYTEQDIRQLARCFTGSEIRYGQFRFNSFQHDRGEKQFLGAAGSYDREQAVDVVVKHPPTARFLVRKLVQFYVADDLPADSPLIARLAEWYREQNLHTGKLLARILASRIFFSAEARGARICGPVELAVGLMRNFGLEANMDELASELVAIGQLPFYPPSVAGWDGGTKWINAQTLTGRANLVARLMRGSAGRLPGASGLGAKDDVASLVEGAVGWLLAVRPPGAVMKQLESIAAGSRDRSGRLVRLVSALATLPEFHLA